MAILSKGTTYSDGDQVTSTNLNALVDSATFVSGAVDDSTTQLSSGAIIVKDLGIAAGKIATNAVTTVKILDSNVTKAKIENVANMKALGNVSGSAAAPAEVAILDEDNMASNSATSLATQQSIKAYADSKVDGTGAGSFTTLAASGDVTFDTTTLKVDSSNNRVGILTASPAVPLDVNGQARVVGNLFVGTDDTTPNGMIEVYGGGTGQNEGGEIRLRTAADFDTTYNHYFIDAYQDDLRIGREGGADITLTSDGNVGIGTALPEHSLSVFKDSAAARTEIGIDNTDQRLVLGSYFESGVAQYSTIQSTNNAETGAQALVLQPDGGNVGIGTATPTHKFHVVGEARFGDGGSVNDDLVLKGSETATVAPGGSVSGAIITTNGTGSASGHVGVEVPANDADDGFFVATDANLDGTVDKIALKIKANGNVGIGETAPTAPLTVTSTTGGVLMPRMTTTQMNAISSPANGEMIYNTTANKFYGYASGAWVALH